MSRIRFADHCEILEGKLPRAPAWPKRSEWNLTKGPLTISVVCHGDKVTCVLPHFLNRFLHRRFVDLLHWTGTLPGNLNVEMSSQ